MGVPSRSASPHRRGGSADYPQKRGDLALWFPDEAACVAYLEKLRWPDGFVCPRCGGGGWRTCCGRWSCGGCDRRVSVTAGTVFAGTRTPLRSWFAAAWALTQARPSTASQLQRVLGLGSYQTAWTLAHRLRAAMPQGDTLTGLVEVEVARIATTSADPATVAIAAETPGSAERTVGCMRLRWLPGPGAASLAAFVADVVDPAATVLTGGGLPPPAADRLARLLATWLPRSVALPHLPAYLDAFAFAWNHRRAPHGWRFRHLLSQAVRTPPVRVTPRDCTEMDRDTDASAPSPFELQ